MYRRQEGPALLPLCVHILIAINFILSTIFLCRYRIYLRKRKGQQFTARITMVTAVRLSSLVAIVMSSLSVSNSVIGVLCYTFRHKLCAVVRPLRNMRTEVCSFVPLYRYAEKSLARPDWKNNWKVIIFRATRSLLPRRPGWKDNLLNFFWVACKS